MDFEHVASNSTRPVGIMGNPEAGIFDLVDLALVSKITTEQSAAWTARGMRYIGVVGVIDGKPVSALDEPLGEVHMAELSIAYGMHLMGALTISGLPN